LSDTKPTNNFPSIKKYAGAVKGKMGIFELVIVLRNGLFRKTGVITATVMGRIRDVAVS
jgi:hypothetical protein